MQTNLAKATQYVHAGATPDPTTGAIMTPIYQTSTYVQAAPATHKGYEYARSQNPTRTALENSLAVLEGAKYGLAFSSGVAATDAIIKLLNPGDEVLCANDMYGGSYRIFTKIFARFGIIFTLVDTTTASNITAAITPATKMVWLETPTNPLMNISDINAIASTLKNKNILLVVDNTFASPALQNPLLLGADIVMHSATKYLGGHSDVIQGAVMCNSDTLREQLYFIQKSCGAVPGPQDCFLVIRGIKTLGIRMKAHCENGEKIAHWLQAHPKVAKVYWPGFITHPNHAIAAKQMLGYGGMISFELYDNSPENTKRVLCSTQLFSLAESLGGIESLINHPATMTHASIPREERLKNGLKDNLIRLSVGIEDADDLINDLAQAIG